MPSDLLLDAYADAIARNRRKMTVSFGAALALIWPYGNA
jgi:hypothetical protein